MHPRLDKSHPTTQILTMDGAGIYVIEGDRLVLAGLRGQVPHAHESIRSLPLDRSTALGRAVLERRRVTEKVTRTLD